MKIYKTIQGDTWDTISHCMYGSEFHTNALFDANPKHQHVFIFSANQEINVPVVDTQAVAQLAPWLRPIAQQATISNSELLDLINGYDSGLPYILSYRFVSKFNTIVTESSKLEG